MDDAQLLLLAGPPGSGKTTVAPLVARAFAASAAVQSDWLWTTVVNGALDPWEPGAEPQNRAMRRASFSAAARLVEEGYCTVLEGIFAPSCFDDVRGELERLEVPVSYVVLRPSLNVCLARATGRRRDAQHTGALAARGPIAMLYAQFSDLGAYEAHVIDSSELTSSATARRIVDLWGRGEARLSLTTHG